MTTGAGNPGPPGLNRLDKAITELAVAYDEALASDEPVDTVESRIYTILRERRHL